MLKRWTSTNIPIRITPRNRAVSTCPHLKLPSLSNKPFDDGGPQAPILSPRKAPSKAYDEKSESSVTTQDSVMSIISLEDIVKPAELIKAALAVFWADVDKDETPSTEHKSKTLRERDKMKAPLQSALQSPGDSFEGMLIRSSLLRTVPLSAESKDCLDKPAESQARARVERFRLIKRTLNSTNLLLKMRLDDIPMTDGSEKYRHLETIERLKRERLRLRQLLKEGKPSPQDYTLAMNVQLANIAEIPTTNDLSRLLQGCTHTDEINRVVSLACSTRIGAERLMEVYPDLEAAFHHCRQALYIVTIFMHSTLNLIRSRVAKLSNELLVLGMKYAIMSRSYPSLRRYLLEYLDNGYRFDEDQFSSLMKTFSLLHHTKFPSGDVEFRDWTRELSSLLTGSTFADDGVVTEHGDISFRSLMPACWRCYHSYIVACGHVRAKGALWREWYTWRKSSATQSEWRRRPNNEAFIEAFLLNDNDPIGAWMIVQERIKSFDALGPRAWRKLLKHPEAITVLPQGMNKILLPMYQRRLNEMEGVLHVKWVGGENGYHVPTNERRENDENDGSSLVHSERTKLDELRAMFRDIGIEDPDDHQLPNG